MSELERFEKLREMGYTYDPQTGDITSHKGKVIEAKAGAGYIGITFNISGKAYSVRGHRFCYWFYYGVVPDEIDHINRIKTDNRICNLRSITHQQNQWNRPDKGCCYHKLSKKYRAQITLNNKTKHLGLFETEQEARAAYLQAKTKYHKINDRQN